MVKLRAKRKTKQRSKKQKEIEEITLDSDSEIDQDEVMEVSGDEDAAKDVDLQSEKDEEDIKEKGIDEGNTEENLKENGKEEENTEENGKEIESEIEKQEANDNTETNGDTPMEVEESKEGVPDSSGDSKEGNLAPKLEINEGPPLLELNPVNIDEVKSEVKNEMNVESAKTEEIKPVILKHPELKPGHVWTREESKEIFEHLVPRVALVKLKHSKKYVKESKRQNDDTLVDKLIKLTKSNMIMTLANGDTVAVKQNGMTEILPPNYKEVIDAKEKRIFRWKEESDWLPPKTGVGKKLNITNVKFGRSIKQPKLLLPKIDPL